MNTPKTLPMTSNIVKIHHITLQPWIESYIPSKIGAYLCTKSVCEGPWHNMLCLFVLSPQDLSSQQEVRWPIIALVPPRCHNLVCYKVNFAFRLITSFYLNIIIILYIVWMTIDVHCVIFRHWNMLEITVILLMF